jgi:chromosomal replication initiation ATPase DnaA
MTLEEFLAMPIKVPKGLVMPKGVKPAMSKVRRKHGVSAEDVFGKSRLKNIVAARREFIALLYFKYGYDHYTIAHILQMDRTSVLHHLGMRRNSPVSYTHLKSLHD